MPCPRTSTVAALAAALASVAIMSAPCRGQSPAAEPPAGVTPGAPPASGAPSPDAAPPAAGSQPAPEQPPEGAIRRVHVVESRSREFGGWVIADDDTTFTVRRGATSVTFEHGRVLNVIELVDVPASGATGLITMRDGTSVRAHILDDGFDAVVYSIAGIRTVVPRDRAWQVMLDVGFDERYRKLKAALRDDDVDGRLAMCRWLFEQRAYDEALTETRALIATRPIDEAKRLLAAIEAQVAVFRSTPSGTAATGGAGVSATPRVPASALPDRLLTPTEVNLIRVYEIDFNRPPKVTISADSIKELIAAHASSDLIPESEAGRTRLFTQDPIELVKLMFDLRARDLYDRIQVDTEPHALNMFRTKVHNAWLLGNCATSRCHGGLDGGNFFLHARNGNSDSVRYTNLLILLESRFDGRPMVDFDQPHDSLLVQHALPRSSARFPHPDVPGWKPVFDRTNERLMADCERWIASMHRPRPEYPVDFDPPSLRSPDAGDLKDVPESR
jgi:hypothetical protein